MPHSRWWRWLALSMVGGLAFSACSGSGHRDVDNTDQPSSPGGEASFDLDAVPAHVEPAFAEGFQVSYRGHAKVVTLANAWGDGHDHRLVLVPHGAPVPADYDDATLVRVPVRRVITTSTTELPAIVMLGEVEHLIGHATFDYVFAPEVRERIDAGLMVEVGHGGGLDVERIIAAEPDLVLADTLGNPEFDPSGMLGVLQAAGVPVAIVPSFLETTPLGRAEWLKYVALFFDREAEANALFDDIVRRYQDLATRGRAAVDRPTVITGGPAGDIWHVPGGESYAAQLLDDAGFDYLFAADDTTGSRALAFEAVHATALDAAWWIRPRRWSTREAILASDTRLGDLAAFRAGQVVTIDARLNAGGGNDYWESGTARPDWVLADLVSLAQPHLLPAHTLRFHRVLGIQLQGTDDG